MTVKIYLLVHIFNDLVLYSKSLVKAYGDIVHVPNTSTIAFCYASRDGHEMTEEEKAASLEAQLETCRQGGNNCWAIAKDAIEAYQIGDASTTQMKVLETYGAGKIFMAWQKFHSRDVLTIKRSS